MNRILYHGSHHKITDGVILPKPGYINGRPEDKVTAVFATDLVHARLYAAMRVIGSGWKAPIDDKLYVEKLSDNISGTGYIYVLDSDGFVPDGNTGDYYCVNPVKIKQVIEFDILDEIKNGNIKVYVLQDKVNFADLPQEESRRLWRKMRKEGTFKRYVPDGAQIDNSILMTALSKSVERK